MPFGFSPLGDDSNDMANMFEQLGRAMRMTSNSDSAVNWDAALTASRQAIAKSGDPGASTSQTDAVRAAETFQLHQLLGSRQGACASDAPRACACVPAAPRRPRILGATPRPQELPPVLTGHEVGHHVLHALLGTACSCRRSS